MVYTKPTHQIKDNEKVVLQVNHNYFMRETIATLAKIFLVSLGYAFIVIIAYVALFSSTTSVTTTKSTTDNGAIAGIVVFGTSLAYLVIVITNVSHLISLHHRVTTEETTILSGPKAPLSKIEHSALAQKSHVLEQQEDDEDLL